MINSADKSDSWNILDKRIINLETANMSNDCIGRIWFGREIEVLPSRTTKILKMHIYDGTNYSRIAKCYGISRERVRQICSDGLSKIRRRNNKEVNQ